MALEDRRGKWWFRFRHGGHEYRHPTGLDATSSNEKRAQAAEAEFRLLLSQGRGKIRRVRFRSSVEAFLKWCESVEYAGRKSTYQSIAVSFASLVEFLGDLDVCDITQPWVEDYKRWRIEEHQIRPCTLRNNLVNLGMYFRKWAIPRRQTDRNPLENVSKPSVAQEGRTRVLSIDEERKYLKAAAKESAALHDLARLMLETGARPEEILRARVDCFDAKKRTLLIPGGKTRAARRTLTLTTDAYAVLAFRAKQSKASPWLFPSPRKAGEHLTKLNAQHDAACAAASMSFTLYDLRHTFATRMVESGVELPTLASILGHSGLTMVMRYVHPTAASQAAAMARFQTWRADQTRTKKRTKTA